MVGPYSYIKHLKKPFGQKPLDQFQYNWQKCSFGDPLSRFSSSCHDALRRKKHGGWGGGVGAGL